MAVVCDRRGKNAGEYVDPGKVYRLSRRSARHASSVFHVIVGHRGDVANSRCRKGTGPCLWVRLRVGGIVVFELRRRVPPHSTERWAQSSSRSRTTGSSPPATSTPPSARPAQSPPA